MWPQILSNFAYYFLAQPDQIRHHIIFNSSSFQVLHAGVHWTYRIRKHTGYTSNSNIIPSSMQELRR